HPKYKCVVNREKSLTNFDVIVDGEPIEKLNNTFDFPWCGILIHTSTLNCKVDCMRYGFSHIADTLTVKTSRNPGEALKQKMIELGMHAFYRILSRKQSYHKRLLEYLKPKIFNSPMNKVKQLRTA
ncbi:32774_t:CDS:2, partial [Racocetra persica]